MSNKKPTQHDNRGKQTGSNQSSAKPVRAADLKPISGGFVRDEVPIKVPETMTIKIKLLDSDLSAEKPE